MQRKRGPGRIGTNALTKVNIEEAEATVMTADQETTIEVQTTGTKKDEEIKNGWIDPQMQETEEEKETGDKETRVETETKAETVEDGTTGTESLDPHREHLERTDRILATRATLFEHPLHTKL